MKLDPEKKAKWIDALRNKYKKHKGCLRRGDAFCCIGVYADIFVDGSWVKRPISLNNTVIPLDGVAFRQNGSNYHYYGTISFDEIHPQIQYELIKLNDTSENWDEVIKYIEERL